MHIQDRTDNQVRQFMAMWRYGFLLAAIVFVVVSMSGSLAAMGLTVAFVSMILGWSPSAAGDGCRSVVDGND